MKKNSNNYVAIVVIGLLGFLYQHNYLNEFPSFKHAWAQSDRYALSLGFLDNGLNFLKPQTFIYNHQFPSEWKMPEDQTITAVDFPIHDYIPALLMKAFGTTSPWVFRLYILLYSFIGLYYLFKLVYNVTNDFIKSVFVVIFAATSPVYVYYQGGFLPTIPSLSNAIIGIYFYYKYLQKKKAKSFWLTILFTTLAALSRLTFVIPLIALLAIEFLRLLKRETRILPLLLPVSLSALVLISSLIYNSYLRTTYGSIFLSHILPPDGFGQAMALFKKIYDHWFFQYFTGIHYLIILSTALLAFYYLIKFKVRLPKPKLFFGLFIIIDLLGCIMFMVVMLKQFPDHDYYFLDTFYLPVILILMLLLSVIPFGKKEKQRIFLAIIISVISLLLILKPIKTQEKVRKTGSWDKIETTIKNFKDSSLLLDSLGVPQSAKILVMDPVAPNIPFILMKRKGFVVMTTNTKNIKNALSWDFDYAVFQDEYFVSDIYNQYPGILSKLNKIGDNGRISVCEPAQNNQQSLLDYLGLNKKTPVFTKLVNFEMNPDTLWHNYNPTGRYSFSGSYSGHLTPDLKHGLAFKTKNLPELSMRSRTLLFHAWFLHDTTVNCQIVAAISTGGKNIYFEAYNLKNLVKQKGVWEEVYLIYQLPKVKNSEYKFSLFIWNTGKSECYYDDFGFSIY